jgi:hypothetical protein
MNGKERCRSDEIEQDGFMAWDVGDRRVRHERI